MLKRLLRIIGDLLVIGLAVSFAYVFVSIKISGAIIAVEPNQAILWAERLTVTSSEKYLIRFELIINRKFIGCFGMIADENQILLVALEFSSF